MRICPSCGRENADHRDFCECGEYLRWEPTQHVSAVKPPPAAGADDGQAMAPSIASADAAAPAAGAAPAPPVEPQLDPNVTLAPAAVVAPQEASPAMPVGPEAPAADEPPPGAATLLLRLPESDESDTAPIVIGVKPGERAMILGLIRNESGIVDNYDLSVSGLPDGWWTIAPATAYLVPYGTSGTYEQEVQIYLHPPRSPEAEARPWAFEVTAKSRAYQTEVAHAPATVEIQPYQDIAGKIAPDRGSGRLKARFLLTVRNRANAPTEVLLTAEDADGECEFRFAQPSITVDPGRGIEAPFTVFPDKQIWIGRPKDRSIRVSATPAGAEQPPPPIPAVYRQRSWLPWWLSVVAPIVAVAIALFILLAPKQTVVPNLKAKSPFAAQKLLIAAGLKLSPQVGQATVAGAAPGSIVDQTPAAGKKVKRGTAVSIEVAVASSTVKVPSVVGDTPQVADINLRASGLVLGTVSPKPDPNGKIGSQIPAAQLAVAKGTPVAVFLQPPASASKPATAGSSTTGTSGKPASKSGAAGAKPIVIPAVSGGVMAAAQTLSQKGLLPTSIREFNPAPAGTLLGTSPAGGKSLAPGSHIVLIVSAGFPQLAYDDGNAIHIVGGSTGKTAAAVPASPQQVEPSWSIDGSHIVYVEGGGQLMLYAPNQKGAQPFALTAPGADDHVPSFAPTTKANIVAFVSGGGQNKLCFATIGPNLINPDCTSHPGWSLGRQVAWSPNGSAILVFGSELGHGNKVFGLIEFVSNVPFSTHASDWGQGTVVTNVSTPGQGVIAGVFSPSGKRLALVANFGTLDFHVFLSPSNDFGLAHAQVLPVRACQVSWRSDGNELAVMQADSACLSPTGDIVAVNPASPNTFRSIATQAEYPAWQPLSLGG